MSVKAISWALNLAPVPTGRGGQPSCVQVLVGLANHARPDGAGAFPSVATLVRYTGLSERTVRTAWIKPADRRPKGWDLDLIRDDLTVADIAALGHQFPGLCSPHELWITGLTGAAVAPRFRTEVQRAHRPDASQARVRCRAPDGVQFRVSP